MRQYVACAVAAACVSGAAAADVVFSDTEFATAGAQGWAVESVLTGGASSVTVSQASNGNPGLARRVEQTVAASSGSSITTLHRYGTTAATIYTPSTQGAIASLNFTIDHRSGFGATPAVARQFVHVAFKQGTVLYIGPGIDTGGGALGFSTFSLSNLTAADFAAVGGAGSPNFSASGGNIRFGFITRSTYDPQLFATSRVDYDNWSVRVVQVPSPAGGALAMMGLIAAGRKRRRG